MDFENWRLKKLKTIDRLKQELTSITNALKRHECDLESGENGYKKYIRCKINRKKTDFEPKSEFSEEKKDLKKSWIDNFV